MSSVVEFQVQRFIGKPDREWEKVESWYFTNGTESDMKVQEDAAREAMEAGLGRMRLMKFEVISSTLAETTARPEDHCPQCGALIKEKWSGVECSAGCGWWFCA